jgi:hypothetical protein
MPIDRYTRAVLTVIATALVYLCVVLSSWPVASAQGAQRPGSVSTTPLEVIVAGWRLPQGQSPPVVEIAGTPNVRIVGDVRVSGTIETSQRRDMPDRVVLVGWEDRAIGGRTGVYKSLDANPPNAPAVGVPVAVIPQK